MSIISKTCYFVLNILHISFRVGVCFWTKCKIGSLYFLTFLKPVKEQQIFKKVVCFEFSGILELPKSQAAALRIRTLMNWLELRILIYYNYTQSNFICPIKIIWKRSNKMILIVKRQKLLCTWAIISESRWLSQRGPAHSLHHTPPIPPPHLSLPFIACSVAWDTTFQMSPPEFSCWPASFKPMEFICRGERGWSIPDLFLSALEANLWK